MDDQGTGAGGVMRGRMMDFPLTLGTLLTRAETLFADVAVITRRGDGRVARSTYGEVAARSRRLAAGLAEIGVPAGARVATMMWNQVEHLECFYGIPAHGALCHTLNPRLARADLAHIARDADDEAIVADASLLPVLTPLLEDHPFRHVIVIGEADDLPPGAIDYDRLLDRPDPGPDAAPAPDEHTAAAVCFTSGTTGSPKGVVYSHRALVLHAMTLAMADVFGLTERDTVMPVVPMFHVNAWGLPHVCPLTGAALVLPGRHLDPASLLGLLTEERVTFTAGVPTVWLALLQELDRAATPPDLSALRCLMVGGSAAPAGMIQAYADHGLEVVQAWGMTETTPVGTISRVPPAMDGADPAARLARRATQGRPLPLVEIRARGDEGLVPWDGASMGELEVRGAWVADAYLGGTGAEAFTADGWFRTGDVVTITPDGSMEITDRAKDLIKSGGEWISSVALENALMAHPDVVEAAVVAVPHPRWVERPLACVVLRDGAVADPDALRAHLATGFASWWVPDEVRFLDAIPRTATGKFMKRELRERFGGDSAGSGAP